MQHSSWCEHCRALAIGATVHALSEEINFVEPEKKRPAGVEVSFGKLSSTGNTKRKFSFQLIILKFCNSDHTVLMAKKNSQTRVEVYRACKKPRERGVEVSLSKLRMATSTRNRSLVFDRLYSNCAEATALWGGSVTPNIQIPIYVYTSMYISVYVFFRIVGDPFHTRFLGCIEYTSVYIYFFWPVCRDAYCIPYKLDDNIYI